MASFPPVPRSLGTPVFNLAGTVTTFPLTAPINQGDTVFVMYGNNITGAQPTSIIDSAGNIYVSRGWPDVGMPVLQLFVCAGANAVPVGGTISVTTIASGRRFVAAVAIEQQQGSVDTDNQTNNGTATSAGSIATGGLEQPNELIIGLAGFISTAGAITHGGSWTELFNVTSTQQYTFAYQNVAVLTSVAYAPTWVNSVVYRTRLLSCPYGWSGLALARIGGCGNPTGSGVRFDNQCYPF